MAKREPLKVKVGDLLLVESWGSGGRSERLIEVKSATKVKATDDYGTVWSLVSMKPVGSGYSAWGGTSIARVANREDIQRVRDDERMNRLRNRVRIGYETDLVRHLGKVPERELTALLAAIESALNAAGVKTDG